MVPLHGRADRDVRRDPIVVSRTGYTGELATRCGATVGRAGRVGRDLVGRRRPWAHSARPGGARHPPHRVGVDLRRVRVRRPGRPLRGGSRIRRRPANGRRLRWARGAGGAACASPAGLGGTRACRERDRRSRRRGLRRTTAGRRRDERNAQPDPKKNIALARVACSTRSSEPRSRSGSSTGSKSGSRRPSSASPSTTRTRRARAARARRCPSRRTRSCGRSPLDHPRHPLVERRERDRVGCVVPATVHDRLPRRPCLEEAASTS